MPEHASKDVSFKPVPLLCGPLAFLMLELLAGPGWPEGPMLHVAGLALWMSIWWVTEAVPLAVTALLPFVVFPLTGVMPADDTASSYFNSVVFLFLGGFMMAIALERFELHHRIAATVLRMFGRRQDHLLLGVMLATAFISMWMSNTAVALLMMPVALALGKGASSSPGENRLATALVLGVVYASSIGGIGTPLGSPPNLVLLQVLSISFPGETAIGFLQWMAFCIPLMLALLLACWLLLRMRCLGSAACGLLELVPVAGTEHKGLDRDQWLVGGVFSLSALLWLTRAPMQFGAVRFEGWGGLFVDASGRSMADDGMVAMLAVLLLFVIPASARHGSTLLRWEDAQRVPWGIVLLFGGGFALAEGVIGSGLSQWCGDNMLGLALLPPLLIVVVIYVVTTALGELASNTAIAQILLPVAAGLAISAGISPLLLMMPVTLGASLDFVLPSATPPNAIGLATGHINVGMLVRNGLLMELAATVLVTAAIWLLGGPVLGIHSS